MLKRYLKKSDRAVSSGLKLCRRMVPERGNIFHRMEENPACFSGIRAFIRIDTFEIPGLQAAIDQVFWPPRDL